jgi:hypothetical protein
VPRDDPRTLARVSGRASTTATWASSRSASSSATRRPQRPSSQATTWGFRREGLSRFFSREAKRPRHGLRGRPLGAPDGHGSGRRGSRGGSRGHPAPRVAATAACLGWQPPDPQFTRLLTYRFLPLGASAKGKDGSPRRPWEHVVRRGRRSATPSRPQWKGCTAGPTRGTGNKGRPGADP